MNGGSRFKLWKSIEGDHSRAVSHASPVAWRCCWWEVVGNNAAHCRFTLRRGAVADDCQCGRARQNLVPFFSQKTTFLKIPETN